jgi:hypothetical protein
MANNSNNKKYSGNDLARICAFVALMLSAILWVILAIPGIDGNVKGTLSFVKDIALLIAIAIPAYKFAKSLGKTWVIVYWVVMVVAIVFLVLGGFSIL